MSNRPAIPNGKQELGAYGIWRSHQAVPDEEMCGCASLMGE